MIQPSKELTVLRCDPVWTCATWQSLFVLVWRGVATVARATENVRFLTEFAAHSPAGIAVAIVLEPEASPPEDRARVLLAEGMRQVGGQVRGIAYFLPIEGFKGAVMRSVVTGLSLLARETYPVQVFGRLPEAARWLHERLPPEAPAAAKIASIVAEARTMRALSAYTSNPFAPRGLGYAGRMASLVAPDFYFDFISPYAYLAWRRWPALVPVPPRPCPVVFGAILSAWGTLGPAEVAPKREFLIRDVARRARRAGLPLRWPPAHPWSPLLSLRLALPEVAGEHQSALIDALFRAAWEQGRRLGDEAEVRSILEAAGLGSSLVDEASKPAAKEALRAATERAVARGVFGVPTIDAGGELFWGDDQLETVAERLAGQALPDEPWVSAAIASAPAFVRAGAPTRPAAPVPPARPPESSLTQEQAERVMGIFERSRFTSTLGLETRRLGEGRCDTELRLRPDHLQQDGVVHAGVQATMADHTAGAAAMTLAPAGSTVLTIEFKVNLLRAARGDQLRCEARVLRGGRRVSVVEADVFAIEDNQPTLVSKAIVTLAIVEVDQMKKE